MTASDADVDVVAMAIWSDPKSYGDERTPWDQIPGLMARGVFKDASEEPYDPRDSFRAMARAAIAADPGRKRALEALTPSRETKAEYIGEFSFAVVYTDDNGDEHSERLTVPWTTIKEIMAAIRKRAALDGDTNG